MTKTATASAPAATDLDTFTRTIKRERGNRWCSITIKLEDGRLSITGDEGRVVGLERARRMARQTWESYFDTEMTKAERIAFVIEHRPNSRAHSARYCAKLLLEIEAAAAEAGHPKAGGELHGLDVVDVPNPREGVRYVLESCGQIRDTLARWFPECEPLFAHHLNDMHAGNEHQEALGWGHGVDVALARQDMTDAQVESLTARNRGKAKRKVLTERAEILDSPRRFTEFLVSIGIEPRVSHDAVRQFLLTGHSADETIPFYSSRFRAGGHTRREVQRIDDALAERLYEKHTAPVVSEIFPNSIGAPCPVTGYRYGTKWLRRELPAEIVELAATVLAD